MRHALPRSRPPGAVLIPAVLLPLGLLGACANGTEEGAYAAYIQDWVGKPVAQLTTDWGQPDVDTAEGGMRALQYNFSRTVSFGERPIRIGCSTVFMVDGGVVREATARGDGCAIKNQGPQSRWK